MLTIVIVIITAIVSVVAFNNRTVYFRLLFNAYQIRYDRQYWRFLSYAFVHAGWGHLLINMLVLYSFGANVESHFASYFGATKGGAYFVMLYVFGILFSTLVDYGRYKDDYNYNAVGASGAVNAVLFASILLAPLSRLIIFPIPIPIPAWIFGLLYLGYSVYMSKRGNDNIGHSAHFWGALFGLLFTFMLMRQDIIAFYSNLLAR